MFEVTGLFGLIALGLWLYALVSIIGSAAGPGAKVIWILIVALVPFIGFILWLFFGPRAR
ncbi:MAG: PLD nuclease N-terminal domain-containing protein [Pseudomonadota bacterium]